MIGFQPYETFQLLIESGGTDRANTLLIAACDAFARRGKPHAIEIEQFEELAIRLFPSADQAARMKAAATLGRSHYLSPKLEQVVIENIGPDLSLYLEETPFLSEQTMVGLISTPNVDACAVLAGRSDLGNVALSKLFQMNSRKVYRALADNRAIHPRGPYLNALARSAQMDHKVAWTLATRDDFDKALLAPAFFDLREEDRIRVINAFALRKTPDAPIKKTIEQVSVAVHELTAALMKLFSQNRRAEVTRLLTQITGLDEIRCGQIAHDVSGAALFVVLRAFGLSGHEGLKVLIHATSHDEQNRSEALSAYAKLFQNVSADAMAFLLSSWRGEVNLLDLEKPQYSPFAQSGRRTSEAAAAQQTPDGFRKQEQDPVITQAVEALERLRLRRAS